LLDEFTSNRRGIRVGEGQDLARGLNGLLQPETVRAAVPGGAGKMLARSEIRVPSGAGVGAAIRSYSQVETAAAVSR